MVGISMQCNWLSVAHNNLLSCLFSSNQLSACFTCHALPNLRAISCHTATILITCLWFHLVRRRRADLASRVRLCNCQKAQMLTDFNEIFPKTPNFGVPSDAISIKSGRKILQGGARNQGFVGVTPTSTYRLDGLPLSQRPKRHGAPQCTRRRLLIRVAAGAAATPASACGDASYPPCHHCPISPPSLLALPQDTPIAVVDTCSSHAALLSLEGVEHGIDHCLTDCAAEWADGVRCVPAASGWGIRDTG